MTVQELFNKIGFPAIAEALRHTHRNEKSTECLTGYKEAFDILCNLPFDGCGGEITFDVTPREKWDDEDSLPLLANNVEGDHWENIVGKTVVRPDDNPFTDAELAGAILWGATFYGFTPHDRWHPYDESYSKYGALAERLERKQFLPYLRNKKTIRRLSDYSVPCRLVVAFTMEEWDYIHVRLQHQNRDYYPNTKTFLRDGDKFICIVYSSSAHPLTDDELSRLNRLFATYFAGVNINWHLIMAIDNGLGVELALKYLCIEK